MPAPTPAALRRALATHPTAEDAYRALGTTRQTIHAHPKLVAVLHEHQATQRAMRNDRGELGKHTLAVPPDVAAHLRTHGRALSRVVRGWVALALQGPLPSPSPADGGVALTLDLGPTWGDLGAAVGSTDPQEIAAALRAILVRNSARLRVAEKKDGGYRLTVSE